MRAFKHEATDGLAEIIRRAKQIGECGDVIEIKTGAIKVTKPLPADAPEGAKPEVILERDDADPAIVATKEWLGKLRSGILAIVAEMDKKSELFGSSKVFSPDRG